MARKKEDEFFLIEGTQKPSKLIPLSKYTGLGAVGLGIAAAVLCLIGIAVPALLLPGVILGIGAMTAGATAKAMQRTHEKRLNIGFYSPLSDEAVVERYTNRKAVKEKEKKEKEKKDKDAVDENVENKAKPKEAANSPYGLVQAASGRAIDRGAAHTAKSHQSRDFQFSTQENFHPQSRVGVREASLRQHPPKTAAKDMEPRF